MRMILITTLVGLSMAAAPSTKRLQIDFGGGYAVVVSANKTTMDVGPVRKPHWYATKYLLHPLKLSVTSGLIDPQRTTLPMEDLGHGTEVRTGWDLTSRTVTVFVKDEEFPAEPVALPPDSGEYGCDTERTGDENNRHHLPDVTDITGQRTLAEDWPERLEGRIRFHGGSLAVTRLTPGCYSFSKGGVKRRLASGLEGLRYTHDLDPAADVVILRVQDRGRTVGDIAIVPDGGMVRLKVNAGHAPASVPHEPIANFKHFYWLLRGDVPSARRQIPTWLGTDRRELVNVTPGDACPSALYEVP